MPAVFTGFDSAWGTRQRGAVFHLVRAERGARLDVDTWCAGVAWSDALERLSPNTMHLETHVIAIDQPLLVPNATGSRPVDLSLARALMKDYALGAHAANRANACFGASAGIWTLLSALDQHGYVHDPAPVAEQRAGRFYFECYPNASLVGWLDKRPRYKVRLKNREAWSEVVAFLRSLEDAELPLTNARDAIPEDLPPTKPNEDKLDALIAAYTAAYLWRYALERSVVLGDSVSGYIVTPVNARMRRLFAERGGPS
jgi:predicted RNase H-like nuclease